MKSTKGIVCTTNRYNVTAIAIKDGNPVSVQFYYPVRNSKDCKKIAADVLDVKKSNVVLDFKLEKIEIVAYTDADTLIKMLDAKGIQYDDSRAKSVESENKSNE